MPQGPAGDRAPVNRACDTDTGFDRGQEYRSEETGEGIAIHIGRFIQFLGHSAHEPFQNPDCQWDVKEAMRQSHGDVCIEQLNR